MKIGFCGYAGSGKDTAALAFPDARRAAFAYGVRMAAIEFDPYFPDLEKHYGELLAEHGYEKAKALFPAHVRDTLVKVGHGGRVSFSETFWIDLTLGGMSAGTKDSISRGATRFLVELDPYIKELGMTFCEAYFPKELDLDRMQAASVILESERKRVIRVFTQLVESCSLPDAGMLVITDVRYENEADRIRELGGFVIRVDRPGVGPANATEKASIEKTRCDAVVVNESDIETFHKRVRSAAPCD